MSISTKTIVLSVLQELQLVESCFHLICCISSEYIVLSGFEEMKKNYMKEKSLFL